MTTKNPKKAESNRTHYTFTITAREKGAIERYFQPTHKLALGDRSLLWGVLYKIAALPRRDEK